MSAAPPGYSTSTSTSVAPKAGQGSLALTGIYENRTSLRPNRLRPKVLQLLSAASLTYLAAAPPKSTIVPGVYIVHHITIRLNRETPDIAFENRRIRRGTDLIDPPVIGLAEVETTRGIIRVGALTLTEQYVQSVASAGIVDIGEIPACQSTHHVC